MPGMSIFGKCGMCVLNADLAQRRYFGVSFHL
jgi:hypothetical protein